VKESFQDWSLQWGMPVNTIKEYKSQLLEFFDVVIENSGEWNTEAILQAHGCASFQNSFHCCFLLKVFSGMFSHRGILHDVLKTKSMDIAIAAG
jgi:hypothetical protein